MKILELLRNRRSYYNINRNTKVTNEEIENLIRESVELVPDAFNMKAQRVVLLLNENQDKLWDTIYDVFDGQVAREKIDSFKKGIGTVLYFYDEDIVKGMQANFTAYADNFPVWVNQASGMLQISIWSGLRELGLGASLQHYNPVIDVRVKELFNIPQNYKLIAQMPFGNIVEEPDTKEKEDIGLRVKVFK